MTTFYEDIKIAANIHRDLLQTKELKRMGWHVIRLWETDVLKNAETAAEKIGRVAKNRSEKH